MTIPPIYIGCDIAKAHFDVFDPEAVRRQQHRRLANTPAGARAFARALAARPAAFVVLEATGAYDRTVRQALAAAGVACHTANPMQTRRFAQAKGRLAKTDKLDASLLAAYGQAMAPAPDPAPDPTRERLVVWVRRRDQLVAMQAEERVRSQAAPAELHESFEGSLRQIGRLIAEAEQQIAALSEASPELADQRRLLVSAPGVGPVTASVLLSDMPELGRLSAKQIAALAGLAPMNQDSGMFRGARRIRGGRRRVRRALYMAALQAKRHPRFKAFYERVLTANPSKKAALIAVARKLLVSLNAMLKNKATFTP